MARTSPSRITMNNNIFTNKLDSEEQFNKCFISVGPRMTITTWSFQRGAYEMY